MTASRSSPGHSHVVCNIENMGVAWVQGYLILCTGKIYNTEYNNYYIDQHHNSSLISATLCDL